MRVPLSERSTVATTPLFQETYKIVAEQKPPGTETLSFSEIPFLLIIDGDEVSSGGGRMLKS